MLEMIEAALDGDAASAWERGFLADLRGRLTEHGTRAALSAKQWAVLDRVQRRIGWNVRHRPNEEEDRGALDAE